MMKMKKKEAFERTKIVVRCLPPSLSQSHLFSQFDHLFSHRYNWFCFRPGKSSNKHQRYSRAYIDFKSPEDVLEFAELFNGHLFVNEKGAQFKAIVEYAPFHHVPKPCTRKDGREGTIYKDPDYLEFLKLIAKPVENLPSANIQLERKEAEQSDAAKETPISTPLMEYVRRKRAAKGGTQGLSAVVKVSKKAGPASLTKPGSSTTKRGSEKKKCILKESAKKSNWKGKSVTIMAAKQDNRPTTNGKEIREIESISAFEDSVSKVTLTPGAGKKKVLLLKGKEHGISPASEGLLQQSVQTSQVGKSPVSRAPKQNQHCEACEKPIRSILLNTDACQNQSSLPIQPQQKFRNLNLKNDKQPSPPTNARIDLNGQVPHSESHPFISDGDAKRNSDDKFMKKGLHGSGSVSKRREKNTKNKDRPDCGIWTTLHLSDVQRAKEDHMSSTVFQQTELRSDFVGGVHGHFGRRVAAYNPNGDSYLNARGAKYTKRASAAGHGAHEKQIWVQKSSSGT